MAVRVGFFASRRCDLHYVDVTLGNCLYDTSIPPRVSLGDLGACVTTDEVSHDDLIPSTFQNPWPSGRRVENVDTAVLLERITTFGIAVLFLQLFITNEKDSMGLDPRAFSCLNISTMIDCFEAKIVTPGMT